jgi:hypothetical protein
MDSQFLEKFEKLVSDIDTIKKTVNETSSTVTQTETKIDKFAAELEKTKKRCDQQAKCIEELYRENDELKYRLDRMEQYSRKDNVIIYGVPWENEENLREKVKEIGEKMNTKLNDHDFHDIHRLYSRNKSKPPPIVVRFNDREKKRKLMAESKRRSRENKNIYEVPDLPITIYEHLTEKSRQILHAAKNLRDVEKIAKFVWIKGDSVFLRLHENAPAIKITGMEQLQEIRNGAIADQEEDDRISQQEEIASQSSDTTEKSESTIGRVATINNNTENNRVPTEHINQVRRSERKKATVNNRNYQSNTIDQYYHKDEAKFQRQRNNGTRSNNKPNYRYNSQNRYNRS